MPCLTFHMLYNIWKPCFVFNQNQFYIKAQRIPFFYFLDWWRRWKIEVFCAFWLSRYCWEDWKFIVRWCSSLLFCALFVFSVYNGLTTQKETNSERTVVFEKWTQIMISVARNQLSNKQSKCIWCIFILSSDLVVYPINVFIYSSVYVSVF